LAYEFFPASRGRAVAGRKKKSYGLGGKRTHPKTLRKKSRNAELRVQRYRLRRGQAQAQELAQARRRRALCEIDYEKIQIAIALAIGVRGPQAQQAQQALGKQALGKQAQACAKVEQEALREPTGPSVNEPPYREGAPERDQESPRETPRSFLCAARAFGDRARRGLVGALPLRAA
jgi:hypothetical protein